MKGVVILYNQCLPMQIYTVLAHAKLTATMWVLPCSLGVYVVLNALICGLEQKYMY